VEELAAMDLVLWEAKHPKQVFFNEKTGKMSSREDKDWVVISLAGPGVDGEKPAGASTLRDAVDAALRTYFADRVPGLRGALLRLEKACFETTLCLMADRNLAGDCDDNEVPF
jgi:hypothetical protein